MYTGITNSDAPRWHHFWNMRTTTHIPIVHARKRILSHRDCSTRCSQFPIFNCNPLPIEYLPLQQSFQFFKALLPITMSSAASRAATLTQGMYPSRTGRYYQSSSSDCWIDPTPLQGLHTLLAPLTWSPLPHTLRGQANLTVLCSFAPALSISRLRANLRPNPAGLPHSPHHALQR